MSSWRDRIGDPSRNWLGKEKQTWRTKASDGTVTQWQRGLSPRGEVDVEAADYNRTMRDLQHWMSGALQRRPYVGLDGRDFSLGEPNTNVLVLAPSQGGGKTSGVIVPAALLSTGPTVVTSSKPDALSATAAARSQIGRCWHFPVDGAQAYEGTEHLRWTVLDGCEAWDVASRVAFQLVELSESQDGVTSRSGEASFFLDQARQVIAPLLQWASRFGRSMDDVYALCESPRPGGPGRETYGLLDIVGELETVGLTKAAGALRGQCQKPERQRESVFSTAAKALRVFSLDATSTATSQPNFSVRDFINSSDTVYVTAANQELSGVLIVMFLTRIIEVTNDAFTEYETAEARGEDPQQHPPVALLLDELATAARISTLPKMLARGNRGYYIVGVLQDLSQAKAIWGNEIGKGMLTFFQNVLIFRGIRDIELLNDVSRFAGDMWVRTHSGGSSTSSSGWLERQDGVNDGWSEQQVPRLPIDLIAQGHPAGPDVVLWLRPDGSWKWISNAPYYRCYPWLWVLVDAVRVLAELPVADKRRLLPLPKLFTAPMPAELDSFRDHFHYRREQLRATREETRRILRNEGA